MGMEIHFELFAVPFYHQMTPLHFAAETGWFEIVGDLVGKEAKLVINAKANNGVNICVYTILYISAADELSYPSPGTHRWES